MKILRAGAAIVALSVASICWAGPVNVNSADAATLAKELNGVGEKTAGKIVEERKKGRFKDAGDLKTRVKGIGDSTIKKNAKNLQFG